MDTTPNLPLDPVQPAAVQLAPASTHLAPASTAHRIFFGRFGFRAGWGIAIWLVFFLVFSILGGIFSVAATGNLRSIVAAQSEAKAHPTDPKPRVHLPFVPVLPVVEDGITFFGLFALCWFFSRAERRPLASYGIGNNRLADFLPGALWGLVMMSLLIFVLKSLHLLIFDGRALHGTAIYRYGSEWLIAFLLVGFSEEYSFRGYVQYTLMRGVWGLAEKLSAIHTRTVAFWIAALITCSLFALAHTLNGGENFFGLVQVFLAGITFCYALWRTGSLWWGIGFHMTWDWAQSFLFGVADSGNVSVGRLFLTHPTGRPLLSGGTAGPEGSLFASIALLLTIAILRFLHRGAQPAIEQQSPLLETPLSIA
jgi:membrane protease YdiL (CAAX protease family)